MGCNSLFITLIPKVENPLLVKDFHPTSLIGMQFKIIAKILAKRLSEVLPNVIGAEQSAFLKGRQILDGPLMVSEMISWGKKKKRNSLFLKLILRKRMILLVGIIWIKLWDLWDLVIGGGLGFMVY